MKQGAKTNNTYCIEKNQGDKSDNIYCIEKNV